MTPVLNMDVLSSEWQESCHVGVSLTRFYIGWGGGGGAQKALALIFSHTEGLPYSSRIHHILR